jgi:hypothetical protein
MPTCFHEDKSCSLQETRNQSRYSSRKYYNIVFFVVRTSNPVFHPHHSNPCCKSLSSTEESETLESQNYKIRPKDENIMSRGASLVSFFTVRLSRDVGFVDSGSKPEPNRSVVERASCFTIAAWRLVREATHDSCSTTSTVSCGCHSLATLTVKRNT